MKILYYDCLAGISGDMNLAAMIDLGVEPEYLRTELDKLGLGDAFDLRVSRDSRNGIRGIRVDVLVADGDGHHHERERGHGHSHEHDHAHGCGHKHTHEHDHGLAHGAHRNFADIRALIESSALSDEVKAMSLDIFHAVAEAEARVHAMPVEEVHFHEVGAVDSIVDIVGAAICRQRLGVDAVWSSSVELGGGFVRCAHGLIPVPAPAAAEILHGVPARRGATRHETTTPTGAAILARLVDAFTDAPAMTTQKTGYGVGHAHMDVPNVLRVHLAETVAPVRVGTVHNHASQGKPFAIRRIS